MRPSPYIDDNDLGGTCLRVMLAIALKQPDQAEREAMLAILRADGWLPAESEAA